MTTSLNPEALEASAKALVAVQQPEVQGEYAWRVQDATGRTELLHEAAAAVSAYLAAALPEVTSSEELRMVIGDVKTAIEHEHLDPREFLDLNDVLWALEAQVQPVVTSVESIPAKMRMLMWEGGEVEVGEIPDGYVLVGFEMETDRSWSMADKVTINIDRPEVNDA